MRDQSGVLPGALKRFNNCHGIWGKHIVRWDKIAEQTAGAAVVAEAGTDPALGAGAACHTQGSLTGSDPAPLAGLLAYFTLLQRSC